MNIELYTAMSNKNVPYYVLALHNASNELTAQYIGEYSNEDDALNAANSYGRKHNSSIVWTLNKHQLSGLSSSIVELLRN